MIRGFLAGLFWGSVVSGLVLAAVSISTPLPERQALSLPEAAGGAPAEDPGAEEPAAAPETPPPVEPAAAPGPIVPPVAEGARSPDRPAPEQAVPPAPADRASPEPAMPEPRGAAPQDLDIARVAPPDVPAVLPVPPAVGQGAPVPPPEPDSPAVTGLPVAPDLPRPDLPRDGGPFILPEAPPPPPEVEAAEAEAEPAPEPEPAARPRPGFGGAVDGVRTGRLPRIGDAPPEEEAAPTPPQPALARNARRFANPEGKPPFAVLLVDTGDTGLDLAALAASDMALTLLVDPARPDAAERARIWRAAGQEVALLTSGLPRSGGATDMEVAMEALESQFPGALALVDPPEGGLQGDRARAAALVPALVARGYGLVTWDRGLNAADQVARREGLPAAAIFRDLDGGGEAGPVIRRYLDRAAFKAQQDGRALVLGRLAPETVGAVLEWGLEGRAAALALAPLSAVLSTP